MDAYQGALGGELLPPEQIRIVDIHLHPYPDMRRVKVIVNLTPFQENPNIDIEAHDPNGERVGSLAVIGVAHPTVELTLHLRGEILAGEYTFKFQLGYQDGDPVDRKALTYFIPEILDNRPDE